MSPSLSPQPPSSYGGHHFKSWWDHTLPWNCTFGRRVSCLTPSLFWRLSWILVVPLSVVLNYCIKFVCSPLCPEDRTNVRGVAQTRVTLRWVAPDGDLPDSPIVWNDRILGALRGVIVVPTRVWKRGFLSFPRPRKVSRPTPHPHICIGMICFQSVELTVPSVAPNPPCLTVISWFCYP